VILGEVATRPSVGILYPGYAAEDDYPVLESVIGDVRLRVVHTSMEEDAHRVDTLLDLGGPRRLAEGARRLQGVDAIVWACTSGSFIFGWEGAREQVDRLATEAGVPASSTSFAFVHAARQLDVRRVAVAATYPDDIALHFCEFLASGGIEVVRRTARGIITAEEVGLLGRDNVLSMAAANDHPEAEAVLLPDTALHTASWLDELEDCVGKPVLTANQVSVWEGLRLIEALAGHKVVHSGAGALFRAPQEIPGEPHPSTPDPT
jgi:maleate cis-trans isomerase